MRVRLTFRTDREAYQLGQTMLNPWPPAMETVEIEAVETIKQVSAHRTNSPFKGDALSTFTFEVQCFGNDAVTWHGVWSIKVYEDMREA